MCVPFVRRFEFCTAIAFAPGDVVAYFVVVDAFPVMLALGRGRRLRFRGLCSGRVCHFGRSGGYDRGLRRLCRLYRRFGGFYRWLGRLRRVSRLVATATTVIVATVVTSAITAIVVAGVAAGVTIVVVGIGLIVGSLVIFSFRCFLGNSSFYRGSRFRLVGRSCSFLLDGFGRYQSFHRYDRSGFVLVLAGYRQTDNYNNQHSQRHNGNDFNFLFSFLQFFHNLFFLCAVQSLFFVAYRHYNHNSGICLYEKLRTI